MYFKQFFDNKLAQYSYLIGCQATGEAIVIDPMRDIDRYIDAAARENLSIVAAADTHIHADYISGLREFAERGVKVYASDEGDRDWKYEWLINSKYDYKLLKDKDEFTVGYIKFKAWHTPGHTPEHVSYYVIDQAGADEPMGIATGDFIFVGDVGRPDLLESAAGQVGVMEPSARVLFKSVEKFKEVPEYLQVWPGHGSGSACGKALGAIPETTVGYELRYNKSIKAAVGEDQFVQFILEGQPEPPFYWARMKRDNKIGPALLDGIPQPKRLTTGQLESLVGKDDSVILDTRKKEEFSAGHIPGSLLAPLNRQFNTVAGSFIGEDEMIYLVVEEYRLREAVTDLIRIGLDKIEGYVTPDDMNIYHSKGGKLHKLDSVVFEDVSEPDQRYTFLDVRTSAEYGKGHVPEALHIAHTRIYGRKDELPEGKKLLVYCQTGERSAAAAAFLKRNGFDVIHVNDSFENFIG